MNREIKFRVWSNYDKKWITDWDHFAPLWGVNLEDRTKFNLSRLDGGEGPYSYVAQQFTGIKDKNGKEIYEGDILVLDDAWPPECGNSIVVVGYHGAGFTYRELHSKQSDGIVGLIDIAEEDEIAEVIGNIFENPELLTPHPSEQCTNSPP